MRFAAARRAAIFIFGAALCAPVPSSAGQIVTGSTGGDAVVLMEPPCRGRDMPTLRTSVAFPPVGASVADLIAGLTDFAIQCRIDAQRDGSPVKGLKGTLETRLIGADAEDPTVIDAVQLRSMPFRTDRSGSWEGMLPGSEVGGALPQLASLPVLNLLFRADSRGKRKADTLLIFCSAQIVKE